MPFSVDFDRGVNLPDEKEGRVETYGPRKEPKCDDHHDGVRKVHQGGHELVNVQFGVEIKHRIQKHINGAASRHDEGPPPPVNNSR